MISVKSLQRSTGDVFDPIKYICSWSASLNELIRLSFLRKLVSHF